MTTVQQLTFVWTPWGVTLAAVMITATAALCFHAWRRTGFARKIGALEGLRLVIVVLVALTLNQPEWLEQYAPEQQPTFVILRDTSGSMKTRDVVAESDVRKAPKTRHESVEPLVDAAAWAPVREKMEVVVESFSSTLSVPEDGTDIFEALTRCLANHKNLRGIALISDGDWNCGAPPVRAASRLKIKNVPVYAIGAGSETRLPDLELARVDAPTFGVVAKPIRIPFVVESTLPRDHEVTITLTASSGEEVATTVVVPGMSRLEETILWTPTRIGDYELTLRVPVDEDELIDDNNQRTVAIAIREEALKMLLVESVPRWEYRYLRNALERDPGVDVACLLFHPGLAKVGGGKGYIKAFPSTMEELSKYDVVFLGDVGVGDGQLTIEQCRLIKGLVESQASGLILMPGISGRQLSFAGTELEPLYPVVLDAAQPRGWGSRVPSRFELTEAGRRSLLTRLEDNEDENAAVWESLPGFQWYAAASRAKVGSQVLATHRSETTRFGRIPLLVTKTYGTGKILFMGTDGAWRWREGVEDKYHYRFWGQVARWMAYQRSMAEGEFMRLFHSPDRPLVAESVTLNANVSGTGGEPLQQGHVVVNIVTPAGKTERIRLAPRGDEWGLFSNTFIPRQRGRYKLTLTCRENGSSLETTLDVQGTVLEKIGRPARFDVLNEITQVTGGKMIGPGEFSSMLEEIVQLPDPEPITRRVRLWCHPLWGGLLVVLLAIFWTGRKMVGTI